MRPKSLFETDRQPTNIPLAEAARPKILADICGQEQLLAQNSLLRQMIDKDSFSSFILWGPPGTGKTTIARCIEQATSHHFCMFSAVLSKIADVKALMAEAEQRHRLENKRTLIFIDEIHRFNKSQQDAFLPYMESGAVILIGATTENPSFEVIPALLSRCHVFVLQSLSPADLHTILQRASANLPKRITLTDEALQLIAEQSGGDARICLNNLEIVCRAAETGDTIDPELLKQYLNSPSLFYDKNGEEHYNVISAFQKSIRGSDPQAALYWLARMIEAGEDPLYITRRLVRIASEDVGLADPQALVQAIAARDAVHFLGMPEANAALSQLTIYLATAPKSNSVEVAYFAARDDAKATSHLKVPLSIRNHPTRLMQELGYGADYRYSHDFPNHYSYQRCFPEALEEKEYYQPSSFGFEREIAKRLAWWKGLKEKQLKTEKKTDDE